MGTRRTVLLNTSLVLAALLACAVALLVASTKPAEAAFPGQNGDIAFVGNLDGSQADDVYVIGPDGTNLRDLRFPGVYNQSPAFSPNGKMIAFADVVDGRYGIWKMRADGTGRTKLTDDEGYAGFAWWWVYGPTWRPLP